MARKRLRFRKAARAGEARPVASEASISDALSELRELLSLSQEQLATELGTKQPNIAAWESGRRVPTVATLERLASRFGVEISIKPGGRVEMTPEIRAD